MNDPLRRAADGRLRRPGRWLNERSDRKEYWAYVAGMMAGLVLFRLLGSSPGGAATGLLTVLWIRRFHDFGLSGWWAVALVVAQLAITIPLVLMGPIGLGLAVLGSLAVIVIMGVIPGQPFENRFGPPRGQRPLSQVFS